MFCCLSQRVSKRKISRNKDITWCQIPAVYSIMTSMYNLSNKDQEEKPKCIYQYTEFFACRWMTLLTAPYEEDFERIISSEQKKEAIKRIKGQRDFLKRTQGIYIMLFFFVLGLQSCLFFQNCFLLSSSIYTFCVIFVT